MSDEVIGKKFQWDPIYLYTRTDEKYEEVNAAVHDMDLKQVEIIKRVERLEDRVDKGVSQTGQMNSAKLADHAVELGKLIQATTKLESTNETIFSEIKEIKAAVALIYKGIVGIFFTVLCGGGVLYALKVFHLN
jgi:hypothetical protein